MQSTRLFPCKDQTAHEKAESPPQLQAHEIASAYVVGGNFLSGYLKMLARSEGEGGEGRQYWGGVGL
jgi:hypothetical protein